MGRLFLEHMGGSRIFSCSRCDTYLTNRSELISTRFTGATGRAFLFGRVVNLTYSDVQDRIMLTGRHMVIFGANIYLFVSFVFGLDIKMLRKYLDQVLLWNLELVFIF